jgi:uncharacterized damage-inducible protein DinB
MIDRDEYGRPFPPAASGESETLLGFLEWQRATFAWKCSGVGASGLGSTIASSSMTLGGLVKHMTYVEDIWFSRRLHGRAPAPPWDGVDWSVDPDWDWHSAGADGPEELLGGWQQAVARSRDLTTEALDLGGLATPAEWVDEYLGQRPSLRWIIVHMIEEYARHNGHADLLREAVDGLTGE